MSSDEGTGKATARSPWVSSILLFIAVAGVCAGTWWCLKGSWNAWIARNRAAAKAAAEAAAQAELEAASSEPEDSFTFWRGGTALLSTDLEMQGLPSPTFGSMLRRIAPTRVGLIVEMPPANYRYVPVQRDDSSDVRLMHALGAGGVTGTRLPSSIDDGQYEEFRRYVEARETLQAGDAEAARSQWHALLGLPPERRPWRSTWAAFMIGRSYQTSDRTEAIRWFHRTRELAADGFADSLGLAVASIGWEARAELDRGNVARAIGLYLEQFAAGDPSAHPSLHLVVRSLEDRSEERLAELARDPIARAVVTAWVIAGEKGRPNGGQWTDRFGERWCDALESEVRHPTPHDDLFAWLAQQSNRPELVARWTATAPPESDLVPWLRSRVALRGGDRLAAATALRAVIERMPERDGDDQWHHPSPGFEPFREASSRRARARTELGALLASDGDFEGALREFLAADDWDDAAYVAERVMTPDELTCFVDAMPDGRTDRERASRLGMRHLLARRLARGNRLDAAMEYMPPEHQPALAALRDALRTGYDPRRTAVDRAAALREAARITRTKGMELLGTELAPDGFRDGGNGGCEDRAMQRAAFDAGWLVRATTDEIDRTQTTGTIPANRYHYRYVAADLAWLAAGLMPDNDAATAETLCEGGRYLMYTDARRADRFYKALVRRCRNTPLGAEAERKRWFPKVDREEEVDAEG